jgi:hypothetical protein
MKRARRIAIWAATTLLVWAVVSACLGIVAVEGALHPGRRASGPEGLALAQAVAARHHATLAEVAVFADDSVTLRGWSIRPIDGNGDAVILLHGQGDDRAGMLGNADLLLGHGYAVLLPDARAQGASGGDLATYGVREASDIRRWADWLRHSETPRCIDGLGESMGAAQLLRSLAAAPGFCAVVAESPFASFREASYDRLGQQFHTGPWLGRTVLWPAVESGFLYARLKYGADLEQASPVNALSSSHVPVLLIHGLKDDNLPPRHSEEIRELNPGVVLWEPAEAGHCGAARSEPAEYERRVLGWFEGRQPKRFSP